MQVGQSVKLVVSVHLILVSTFALRMTGRTINEFASSSEATRRFSLPLPPFHSVSTTDLVLRSTTSSTAFL